MTAFIFFLTYNDRTIPTPIRVLDDVKDLGVKNIGCKDVGIPKHRLVELKKAIDDAGLTSYLEVVSEDRESTLRGARIAAELGVDRLIGSYGQYAKDVMEIIKGTSIEFYPFVGNISGIPSVLHGSIDEIVAEALEKQEMGVAGIDLLAYRHKENPEELMERVIDALEIPVIVAGSIGTLERIRRVVKAGASGFTVGTAIFDRTIVPSGSLEDQVVAVVNETKERR